MTIGIIAKMTIQVGKTAEFEAFFVELAAQVRGQEPGNIIYKLARSRTEPNVYKVLELYANEEALSLHRAADHYKAAGSKLSAYLAARPEIELLDGVD